MSEIQEGSQGEVRNYGFNRQTPWERVFVYFPVLIDGRFYCWRFVERCIKVVDGKPQYLWRAIKDA